MTVFKIGQVVQRIEAHRHCKPIEIINDVTLRYVNDLVENGCTFELVKDVEVLGDFELPVLDAVTTSAPRVHVGGGACVSCEG